MTLFFDFIINHKKNGAPKAEVIMPIGSWAGAIMIRDIKSARISIIAPRIAEPKFLLVLRMVCLETID